MQQARIIAHRKNHQEKILWRPPTIFSNVSLNDYLCQSNVAKFVVRCLLRYGVAIIDNVPANRTSIELTISRLFPIQKSNSDHTMSCCDATKTKRSVHTADTHLSDAAGLQVFHHIEADGQHNELSLLDGFMVLQNIQSTNPDAYACLHTTSVANECTVDGEEHVYCAPIVKLDPITSEPEQIR